MGRNRTEPSLSRIRSAVTNGTQLLAGCDHRTARMRRLRDLIEGHVSDLGGPDHCSQAELSIVRRAALITLEIETLEAKFKAAEGATLQELESYQRSANALRRHLESLGLKRRSRDVIPTA